MKESWRDLSDRLKDISHLRLGLEVPLDRIRQELKNAVGDEYSKIQINLKIRKEEGRERYWYGRGLIDYLPDSRNLYEYLALDPKWIKRDISNELILHETELCGRVPQTMEFIKSITDRPRISRFLKIFPGTFLPWHSHCQSKLIGPLDYRKMILQIPLHSNDGVVNRVRPLNTQTEESEDQIYREGEAWLFNSWHEHAVINSGQTDRVILLVEAPLDDPKFYDLVESSLAQYERAFPA